MLEPAHGTKIGIGYRSEIAYELEGKFGDNNIGTRFDANVDLTTPDIVTVSIQQAVSSAMRVMATFEWTQWSDFDRLDISATQGGVPTILALGPNTLPTGGVSVAGMNFASLEVNWHDAWFASIGAEVDYSEDLTFRAGVAYEESPIQNAVERITAVPDNDRIWLSVGASYRAGQILPTLLGPSDSTLDVAYTHIWVEDAEIERDLISNDTITFFGEADQSVDILSFAIRTKFGHEEVEPFK